MGPSGSGGAARAWLGGSWNRRAGRAAPCHHVSASADRPQAQFSSTLGGLGEEKASLALHTAPTHLET